MKLKYFVSSTVQYNGDHEVHDETCNWLPKPENRIDLGPQDNCHVAVLKAKDFYHKVNGCIHCCRPCHTS